MSSYNDDQPSSAVVLLQSRSKQITNQTLESTRRMITLTDESNQVGHEARVKLNEQGEKLDFIDETSDWIHEDMTNTQADFEEMEKCCCCGLFSFPWTTWKSGKSDRVWKKSDGKTVSTQPQLVATHKDAGFYVDRITNDAVEDEMQENLSQVHSTVGNLKSLAASINSEVKSQNRQLDKIQLKVENNEIHVVAAEKRVQKFTH